MQQVEINKCKMQSYVKDYEVLDIVGSGTFGECQKIKSQSAGRILAWKVVHYRHVTPGQLESLVKEVNLMMELKHPNIVRYHDHILDQKNNTLYIIMEYCEGGDLSSVINECVEDGSLLDEEFILRILAQLTLALRDCHRRSDHKGTVVHRDLKPANIFLDSRNNVKLGDFGLAEVLTSDQPFANKAVGTLFYMCPEKVDERLYDEKSDIWSLGCLVYELCALLPPFTASTRGAVCEKIRTGTFTRIPSQYSKELKSLIADMLQVKDYKRPSVDQIMCSSLLAEVVAEEEEKIQVELQRRSSDPDHPLQQPISITDLRGNVKEGLVRQKRLKKRKRRLELFSETSSS